MKTIRQLKKTPVKERSVQEEYRLAKYEKRQPFCVYCGELLEISQMRDVNIFWTWDEATQSYIKDDEATGASYMPYCTRCETEDWEFAGLLFGS